MATLIRQRALWIVACAVLVATLAVGCSQGRPSANPGEGELATASPTPGQPSHSSYLAVEPSQPGDPPSTQVASATPAPSRPPATATRPRTETVQTAMPTPTPSPSPTPVVVLRQLTKDGCCTQPFWSPDSRHVLFIDKPGPEVPVGIWGVDVTQSDPTPELFTERIAFYTQDLAFRIDLGQDTTVIERLTHPLTGTVAARWTVPAAGRPVSISPGQERIAWQVSNDDLPFERRTTQVWVANLDGSEARSVATLPRGGLGDWISDDVLLLSGSESLESRERVLYTISLTSGRTTELVRAEQIRVGRLSPDRAWLAYLVTLSDDPAQNGLWLVRTDGSARRKLDSDLFGAYQWRDAGRLAIIPFRSDAVSHELWEFDVNTEEIRFLTDPSVVGFKIANGDWSVSPDGRYMAFVERRDRNIWLLTLAD